MTEEENRALELKVFVVITVANYFIFGWYLTILAALSMIISDYVVNKINKLN